MDQLGQAAEFLGDVDIAGGLYRLGDPYPFSPRHVATPGIDDIIDGELAFDSDTDDLVLRDGSMLLRYCSCAQEFGPGDLDLTKDDAPGVLILFMGMP